MKWENFRRLYLYVMTENVKQIIRKVMCRFIDCEWEHQTRARYTQPYPFDVFGILMFAFYLVLIYSILPNL